MARPKKAESIRRTSNVMVRFSSIEYELVAGYAKDAGYPISTFVRKQALSEKVIIKDFLQHLPAWYPLQSSDLRRFHYAESGLVMILIKRNE